MSVMNFIKNQTQTTPEKIYLLNNNITLYVNCS